MQVYRSGKTTLLTLAVCLLALAGTEARAALNFTGGTHVNSAQVTNGGVVQSNPSFTTTGAVSSNAPANANYTTAAPTSQNATSSVNASFDGVATFMASLTSSVTATRPVSAGNSEFGNASSTYTFTLTSPTNFLLSGTGAGSVMGLGSSNDFFVTLSDAGMNFIAGNGDVLAPFSFSGTLQPGSYTISAVIASNGFAGSTNPTIVTSGNYTLALIPEPRTTSLIVLAAVALFLFRRRRLASAK